MAVYIKKDRLGSGPPPRRAPTTGRSFSSGGIMGAVEANPLFKNTEDSYAEAKAAAQSGLKDKYESQADMQRWRTQMTPEERTRDAIERMVPTAKAVTELRNGNKEVSYEQARSVAEQIAYKSERKKKED